MPGLPIILSDQEAATNTDILQGTRLQNAPANGLMTFEMTATVAVKGTNAHLASIQLPDGNTPMNGVLVTAGDVTTEGVLNTLTMIKAQFPVAQGGHVVFSTALTGVSVLTWRAIFTPF